MFDVVTVGSATIDVFASTRFSETIKIIDPKGETDLLAFPVGAKILIDQLEFSTGGGGTNTAVALSRLGHKVAFLGKLGSGANSDFIKKSMAKDKIKLLCQNGDGNTGYSMILDTLEHDRTILTYKGANDELSQRDVPFRRLNSKWFYFSAMMGKSFATLEILADFAQKRGIKIAFNPSMYLAEKGADHLKKILEKTELLVLNKEEAALIAGRYAPRESLIRLSALGPKICVITDGKNDLFSYCKKKFYMARPPRLKVIDTTGAGDAFAASFLSGIIRKNDICFAIKLGMVNCASIVSHYGAKNILLNTGEAKRRMNNLKIKILKSNK